MQEKISQNELRWFYMEPYVLTAWFKDKNKEKTQFFVSRNTFAPRR